MSRWAGNYRGFPTCLCFRTRRTRHRYKKTSVPLRCHSWRAGETREVVVAVGAILRVGAVERIGDVLRLQCPIGVPAENSGKRRAVHVELILRHPARMRVVAERIAAAVAEVHLRGLARCVV